MLENALANKTIVLTHPQSDKSEEFCQFFREQGAIVHHFPMIETKAIQVPQNILSDLEHYHTLVFTSRNGVQYFLSNPEIVAKIKKLNIDVISIGTKTTACLEQYQLKADFTPKSYNSESLVEELKLSYSVENNNILVVQGELAPDRLEKSLSEKNTVKRINVYKTITANSSNKDLESICSDKTVDYYVFTSPSCFTGLAENYKNCFRGNAKLVSIGPSTSKKILELGYKVDITAEESTYYGIYKTIIKNI